MKNGRKVGRKEGRRIRVGEGGKERRDRKEGKKVRRKEGRLEGRKGIGIRKGRGYRNEGNLGSYIYMYIFIYIYIYIYDQGRKKIEGWKLKDIRGRKLKD